VSQTKKIIRRISFNLRREDSSGGPRRLTSKVVPFNHSHITHAALRQGMRNRQPDYTATDNHHF
jgi:hypothetical protein